MITGDPTDPDVGDRKEITGASVTVKATPLLGTPPTVTTTLPVVAPLGTCKLIEVLLQLTTPPGVPLKVTVLAP